jgi:hypothetical protein
MPADQEWAGEPHILIVHSVSSLPGRTFLSAELDYDLEHPQSCALGDIGYGDYCLGYTCAVAWNEQECGLAESLHYSGTPITEPGTYAIQAWGRKFYVFGAGYEYDSGVAVISTARKSQCDGFVVATHAGNRASMFGVREGKCRTQFNVAVPENKHGNASGGDATPPFIRPAAEKPRRTVTVNLPENENTETAAVPENGQVPVHDPGTAMAGEL